MTMTEIGLARRPPAPMPRAGALGPIGLYRALRRNGVEAWREEAFEEPYVADRNQLGGFVLLNDPDLIRYVLIDNAANYPKDDLQLEKLTPAVGRGLLTADGESWRLQRRTVAALFQPQAVAAYIAPMQVSVDAMLTRWAAHARRGETIDIAREMTALTYDIISRTVFSNEIETPPDVMGEAITTYFEALGRIDLWDVLPLPRWLPRPAFIRARPAQKIFRDEVLRLFEQRRARMVARQAVPDDLVTRLINARDPETGAPLSDSVIHDNLVTFIGAGHETTANALTWTLYLLSQAPDWRARVEAEIDAQFDPAAPEAAGEALPVTKAVVEEAMRLYPPAAMLSREAIGPDVLAGRRIPAGTVVTISPFLLHRHRLLWRDPDAFDPERFLGANRDSVDRFAYIPFGAGPRVCIGMGFAMIELMIVLGHLLKAYRFDLAPGHPVAPVARITLRPKDGMKMILRRR